MLEPSNSTSRQQRLQQVLAEFEHRSDGDFPIEPDDLIADHPDIADELRAHFGLVSGSGLPATSGLNESEHETSSFGTAPLFGDEGGQVEETIVESGQSSNSNVRVAYDAPRTQFGRYRILRELGRGGMGAVYLAHDEQLDREVALKIPRFGTELNADVVARFYREARSAAALRHPGICPVYDVGEIDGQHYITMAFIKGRPLCEFTKSSKTQGINQLVRVVRKLALALEEAHQHQVIHRDLKPANVMIDERKDPIVMDFGLARRSTENEQPLTHSGAVIGTPAYMSPEQVDGDNSRVGPPADIYSLGVIFYELLTGRLPFEGSLMSILRQIATVEPTPPAELRADTPPELEAICLKMMAKQIEDRYQSMSQVAADLTEFLKHYKSATEEAATQEPAMRESATDKPSLLVTSRVPPVRPPVEPTDVATPPRSKKRVRKSPRKNSQKKATKEKAVVTQLDQEKAQIEDLIRLPSKPSGLGEYWKIGAGVVVVVFAIVFWGLVDYLSTDPATPAVALAETQAGELKEITVKGVVLSTDPATPAVALAETQAGELKEITVKGVVTRWRWIPAGVFLMGSPANEAGRNGDENQVEVTLPQGFWMLDTEVSQELWTAVTGSSLDWDGYGKGPKYPVYNVSHDEAVAFLGKFNALLKSNPASSDLASRLPTDAEWEYACRAGTTTRYYWGDRDEDADAYAWHSGNSNGGTHPVGTKKPNAWGLYDMSGNVWEWCADWYDGELAGGTDPRGPLSGASSRVNRGGSWWYSVGFGLLRSAFRSRGSAGYRNRDLGFRMAFSSVEG